MVADELRIQLDEDGADAQRLDTLTGYLRSELLALDVQDVTARPGGTPPPGSRAVDMAAISGLLVTLGKTTKGLRAMVNAVRNWLARGSTATRTVRLEIGGAVLELSEATAEDQDRLVALFISRHSTPDAD
jgi:hypothetical protein